MSIESTNRNWGEVKHATLEAVNQGKLNNIKELSSAERKLLLDAIKSGTDSFSQAELNTLYDKLTKKNFQRATWIGANISRAWKNKFSGRVSSDQFKREILNQPIFKPLSPQKNQEIRNYLNANIALLEDGKIVEKEITWKFTPNGIEPELKPNQRLQHKGEGKPFKKFPVSRYFILEAIATASNSTASSPKVSDVEIKQIHDALQKSLEDKIPGITVGSPFVPDPESDTQIFWIQGATGEQVQAHFATILPDFDAIEHSGFNASCVVAIKNADLRMLLSQQEPTDLYRDEFNKSTS